MESKDDWPSDKAGRRLPFVGQLNFAEFPVIPLHPTSGILSVFRADYDPCFVSTWHPQPSEQVTSISGPSDGAWECRLTATIAETVSFKSWWDREEAEGAFDELLGWDMDQSGDIGRWARPNSLQSDQWESGEDWVQVWDELWHETYGSATSSLQVRLHEYQQGDLSNVVDERWQ